MKSGTKKFRGGGGFLTTDYTDLHGWMRLDFFLVVFDLAVENIKIF